MPRVILPPVLLRQRFAISFPKARLWVQTAWRLSVTSAVVVSVAERAQSTKVAIYSRVLCVQVFYWKYAKLKSLWGTWHLNKENKMPQPW